MDEGFDEGFEEEFEERDVPEPNNFELGDLDPKELQQLLEDPQLPNLEDFDLGVDVLDSESITAAGSFSHPHTSPYPPTSPYPTSPYPPTSPFAPTSPYQAMVTSSPTPQMNELNLYNDYNLSESFFCEDPPSVQSNVTSSSHSVEDLPLGMLPPPDSCPPQHRSPSPCPLPPTYHQQASPVLTTAATTGIDLAETTNFLSTDTLIGLSTALNAEDSIAQSMYMFGNGTGHLSLLPPATTVPATPPQVVTLMDSAMLPVTSQVVQPRESLSLTPPPQLSPVSRRPSPSPSPTPSPGSTGQQLSTEDAKLVDMPYYQFRKLLDDPNIPEKRKEDIKNVRRRGRNKTAAKLCRNKKLQMIMGLEQEVEQLRKTKTLISMRTQNLEREISELKKCHNRLRTVS